MDMKHTTAILLLGLGTAFAQEDPCKTTFQRIKWLTSTKVSDYAQWPEEPKNDPFIQQLSLIMIDLKLHRFLRKTAQEIDNALQDGEWSSTMRVYARLRFASKKEMYTTLPISDETKLYIEKIDEISFEEHLRNEDLLDKKKNALIAEQFKILQSCITRARLDDKT